MADSNNLLEESKNSAKKRRATPARRSKKNEPKKVSRENKEVLNLDDVTCGICISLLVEPVTLPCDHSICLTCYLSLRAECNLTCPNCRAYIGGYCRKTARNKNAVNEHFWTRIQKEFPEQVKARLANEDEDIVQVVPMHQLAEPGDLRKEFEKQQEELMREERERKEKEDAASAAILAQLEKEQAEEQARLAELERIRLADEALALELSGHQDLFVDLRSSPATLTPPSTRKRPRKASSDSTKHTPVAKKISSFFPNRIVPNENDEPSAFASVTGHLPKSSKDSTVVEPRSTCSSSSESMDYEVTKRLHFRPINAAPLTPPKPSPSSGAGQIVKPQVVAARNLNLLYDDHDDDVVVGGSGGSDVNHNETVAAGGSGGLADELLEMERQWLRKKLEQEEADKALARQLQEQLDAEERQRLVVNRRKGSQDQYLLRAKKPVKKQSTIEDAFQRPASSSRSSSSSLP